MRLAEYWTKSSGRSTSDSSKELRPSRELRRELVLFVNGAQASELCAETNRYQAMERRPRLWKNEPGMRLWSFRSTGTWQWWRAECGVGVDREAAVRVWIYRSEYCCR